MNLCEKWEAEHPDELATDNYSFFGRKCFCFSSDTWAAEVKRLLGEFIGYVEISPYRDRIIGYQLAIENTLYIVPDGVTRIEDGAFNCSKLVSIDLPDSLKVISGNAFGECTRLTSIEIPNSVATMLSYAFSGCDKATSEKLLSENDWSIRKAAESVKGALQ